MRVFDVFLLTLSIHCVCIAQAVCPQGWDTFPNLHNTEHHASCIKATTYTHDGRPESLDNACRTLVPGAHAASISATSATAVHDLEPTTSLLAALIKLVPDEGLGVIGCHQVTKSRRNGTESMDKQWKWSDETNQVNLVSPGAGSLWGATVALGSDDSYSSDDKYVS
jgi:hypothetical protein